MIFFKDKILLGALMLLSFPSLIYASELRLDASKLEIKSKDEFVVNVNMLADESINTLEGNIIFNVDYLELKEIRDGNSSINLWIEKPNLRKPGTITFSGVTPGGLMGIENNIFSLVFVAKKEGVSMVGFENTRALKNDGFGTEAELEIYNAAIHIKIDDSNIHREILEDHEPPESFNPIVSQEPTLFDNKYFLVFSTNDKGGGIDRYMVKEYRIAILRFLSWWEEVEGPYVLSDQELKSYIVVKATDQSGNARVEKIVPKYPLTSTEKIIYWVIIIGGLIGILWFSSKKMLNLIKK